MRYGQGLRPPGRVAAIGASLAGLVVIALAMAGMAVAHRHQAPDQGATGTATVRPERWTTELAASMDQNDLYRDPDQRDRDTAVAALDRLLAADRPAQPDLDGFRSVGFTVRRGTDADTGRPLVALVCRSATCPGWGTVLVDASAPARLAVEVPHPRADVNTEQLGLDLFRRVPGSVLMMAGAHRRAADGSADVAHNASSMFNAFAGVFAARRIPQVQLHGFADESLPGSDVVVSTGQSVPSEPGERVAAAVAAGGSRACRAWRESCGRLEGTTNEQGLRAAEVGSVFLHIEINYTVRSSAARRGALIDELVASDLGAPR